MYSLSRSTYCTTLSPRSNRRVAGRPVLMVPIILYSDNTSDNKSKEWHKMDSNVLHVKKTFNSGSWYWYSYTVIDTPSLVGGQHKNKSETQCSKISCMHLSVNSPLSLSSLSKSVSLPRSGSSTSKLCNHSKLCIIQYKSAAHRLSTISAQLLKYICLFPGCLQGYSQPFSLNLESLQVHVLFL